ncbi:MAG: hypothetical protein IJ661_00855 [Lachnospiraceae bacterium]|nr:hypothetical protein [Lachnospiraceae bacterium]
MKLQDLRSFIVLLAGLIALIINMKTGREVTVSLLIVLVVILVFYFIGTLMVEILQRGIEKAARDDSSSDDEKDETEEEEAVDEVDVENEPESVAEEEF